MPRRDGHSLTLAATTAQSGDALGSGIELRAPVKVRSLPSPMPTPPRYNVLGVGISALTLAQARDLVVGVRGQLHRGYICLGTAHGLSECRADPDLRRTFNESWLTTPDGMPLVWLGPTGVERVYGPDLMLAVCDAGRAVGLRHYFYGGHPGVAPALEERPASDCPTSKLSAAPLLLFANSIRRQSRRSARTSPAPVPM